MRIFTNRERRSAYSEDDKEVLLSTLPGFVGTETRYTSAQSIQNSDIWSAVSVIATDMASLSLEKFIDGVKSADDNLSYLMNVRPNSYYNGFTLKFIIVANILLNGESFVELVRDESGRVRQLYHLKNSEVTYRQNRSTQMRLDYFVKNGENERRVLSKDILHFKFFSLNGVSGVPPLVSLKDDIETMRNSKRFLNNFFRQGFSGSGILKYKAGRLSKEAREKLKDEWQKANSGTDQAHKVVVLDDTMEYERLEVDTEILKLINTSNFSTEQVAKVFKLPRHKMGLESTNTSLMQANDSYIVNTLSPYLTSLASEINFKLADHSERDTEYKYNVDAFKFVDVETKTKSILDRLHAGVISLNEARQNFGLEAKRGDTFEEHFVSLNYTTLSNLSEYQMNKAKNLPIKGGEDDE